jgi:protein phosphatase PTC7
MTQIPYYKKRDRGGEDAYLISEELLTVADGVGGWNRKGVDPGIFARELTSNVWSEYYRLRK